MGQKSVFLIVNPVQDITVRNQQFRVEKVRVPFAPAVVQAVKHRILEKHAAGCGRVIKKRMAELMARAGPQRTVFSIAVQANILLPVHHPEIAEQIAAVEPAKLDVSPVDDLKRVACLIFADTKIRHAYRLRHHKIVLSLETSYSEMLLKISHPKTFWA